MVLGPVIPIPLSKLFRLDQEATVEIEAGVLQTELHSQRPAEECS
jgi:hypothetical protein